MDPERLASLPLFASLPAVDRARVAQWADEVDVEAGKVLAREGEFAYEFFVIEEGRAEVTKDGKRLTELGPGDFFGEIGLLESERRTATVAAATPMSLVVVFGPNFRHMERSLPELAERVRSAIRERLDRG